MWCGRIPRPAVSASAEDHTDNLSSYLSLSQVQRGILFQSDQCDSDFKTENGLRIHKGKSLKEAFSGVCDDHKDNLPTYLSLKSSLALPFEFYLLSSFDVGSHSPWMSFMNIDLFLVFSTSNCLLLSHTLSERGEMSAASYVPVSLQLWQSQNYSLVLLLGMRICTARFEG